MKLNKLQNKALKTFFKEGYISIDAPRRAGKTTLLKEIIRRSIGKVGVFVPVASMFKTYKDEFGSKVQYADLSCKTLIGDECFLNFFDDKYKNKKIACAGTFRSTMWMIRDIKHLQQKDMKEQIEETKKQMTKNSYYSEFGKYE